MDMREASAMTEASGLTNDKSGLGQDLGARPSAEPEASRRPLHSSSQDIATSVAIRLREVTVKAPLQSLFVAFLLGAWVARRR
jgi:hypothetical protein